MNSKWNSTLTRSSAIIIFTQYFEYLLKGGENLSRHKMLQMRVYSKFIHNCQNIEAIQMSFEISKLELQMGSTIQCHKEMSSQTMKREGGNLNAYD